MIKRILKIFLVLVGLACVGCICIIILFPYSASDLEKRHLDEIYINDPWPVNRGKDKVIKYIDFKDYAYGKNEGDKSKG